MELVCPQCGTTTREDSVDFPLCTHCHEPLVKCGYCAKFDAVRSVCRDRKSGRREVSADDELDCERYRSILSTAIAFRNRVISPANWVLMVAGTLFVLIVMGMAVIGRYVPGGLARTDPPAIEVAARWRPNPPTVGMPFKLEFWATNAVVRTSGPIRLSIPAAFLDRFKILSIDPSPTEPPELLPPEGKRERRNWHYYYFPSVPPQEQTVIVFELVTRPGFVKTGFPLQENRYAYDLTGAANNGDLRGLGVHVYSSGRKGEFSAHRILKIDTKQ